MERRKIVRKSVHIDRLPYDCWWEIIIYIGDWGYVVPLLLSIKGLYDYICNDGKFGSDTIPFYIRKSSSLLPEESEHGYPFVRKLVYSPEKEMKDCFCKRCVNRQSVEPPKKNSSKSRRFKTTYFDKFPVSCVSYEAVFQEITNLTRFKYLRILRLNFYFVNPITNNQPIFNRTIKLEIFPCLIEFEMTPFRCPLTSVCMAPGNDLTAQNHDHFPTCVDFGKESRVESIYLGTFRVNPQFTNKAVKILNFPISTVKIVNVRAIKVVDSQLFNIKDLYSKWVFPSLHNLQVHGSNFLDFMIPTNPVSTINFPKLVSINFGNVTFYSKEKFASSSGDSGSLQYRDVPIFSNFCFESVSLFGNFPSENTLFDWNSIIILNHLNFEGSISSFRSSFLRQVQNNLQLFELKITDTVKRIRFLEVFFTDYRRTGFLYDCDLISNFDFLERLELIDFNKKLSYASYTNRHNTFSVSNCPNLLKIVIHGSGNGSKIELFKCKNLQRLVITDQPLTIDFNAAGNLRVEVEECQSLKDVKITNLQLIPSGNFWNTVENLVIRSCGWDMFKHYERVFDFSKIGMNVLKKVVFETKDRVTHKRITDISEVIILTEGRMMVKEFKNVPFSFQELVIKWDCSSNFGNGVRGLETLPEKGVRVTLEMVKKADGGVEKRKFFSSDQKNDYLREFKAMTKRTFRMKMLFGKEEIQ